MTDEQFEGTPEELAEWLIWEAEHIAACKAAARKDDD